VNNLLKVVMQLLPRVGFEPYDLLFASPTLYPLRHRATNSAVDDSGLKSGYPLSFPCTRSSFLCHFIH